MEDFNKLCVRFDKASYRIQHIRNQIQRNRTDYVFQTEQMDKLYRYLKEQAPYFYDEETRTIDSLYKILADDLLYTETWIPPFVFLVANTPQFIYSPNERLMPSNGSDERILDFIVFSTWQKYAEKHVHGKNKSLGYTSFESKCTYLSEIVADICARNNIECYIIRINPGFLDNSKLYDHHKIHDFCIVKLNSGYYIVDPSYRQFFMLRAGSLERIGIPFLGGTFPGIFMTLQEERMAVASKIIEKGWISFTEENIKHYFDGFALSFRNGLYYTQTNDYSYTTIYAAEDYIRFLKGEDNQVNHEGEEVLKRQITL